MARLGLAARLRQELRGGAVRAQGGERRGLAEAGRDAAAHALPDGRRLAGGGGVGGDGGVAVVGGADLGGRRRERRRGGREEKASHGQRASAKDGG